MLMSQIFIYQILNHYTAPEALDPGFLVLDNSSNERPDWFEYWPIRKFLLNQPLDEESFYGFLSPKFKLKTNLSAAAAHDFVNLESKTTDVVLLSQSVHQATYYLNTFEYGDRRHPGLLEIATQFFKHNFLKITLNAVDYLSGAVIGLSFFLLKKLVEAGRIKF